MKIILYTLRFENNKHKFNVHGKVLLKNKKVRYLDDNGELYDRIPRSFDYKIDNYFIDLDPEKKINTKISISNAESGVTFPYYAYLNLIKKIKLRIMFSDWWFQKTENITWITSTIIALFVASPYIFKYSSKFIHFLYKLIHSFL
jgi:hypothetical protein